MLLISVVATGVSRHSFTDVRVGGGGELARRFNPYRDHGRDRRLVGHEPLFVALAVLDPVSATLLFALLPEPAHR